MKRVTASDTQVLSYDVWGSKNENTIVLIQGLGMDSRGFALQKFLLSRDHRCIVLDPRGSGESPTTKDFSLYRCARDVLRVMEAENVERAHIVGTSMGGIVAQILAVLYPTHVRSLTLISTSCSQHHWRSELLQDWKKRLGDRQSKVLDRDILSWLIGPRLLHRSRLFLPIAQQLIQEIDVDQFCLQIDAICSFSDGFRDRLRSISAPTHVIVGSQDTLTPVGDSEELCMYIKNSKLSIVYGTAHGVIMESPIKVGRLILDGIDDALELEKRTMSDVSSQLQT